jgi:hypothetical protein
MGKPVSISLMYCTNCKINLYVKGVLKTLLFLILSLIDQKSLVAQIWDTTYLPKPINELTFDTINNKLLVKPNGYTYNNITGNFFKWDGFNLIKLATCSTGSIEGIVRFKAKTLVYGTQWSINNLPKTSGIVEWNIQNNTYTKVDTGGLLGDGPFVMKEFNNRLYYGLGSDYYKKNIGYLDSSFKLHYHPDSIPLSLYSMIVYKGKLIFNTEYRPRSYSQYYSGAMDSVIEGNCIAYLDSNFIIHPFAKNSTINYGSYKFLEYHNKLYMMGAFTILDGDSVTGLAVYNDILDKWEPVSDQILYCTCNPMGNPNLWSIQLFNDKIILVGEISHIDTSRAYCVVEYDEQSRKFRNIGEPYFDAARWSGVYQNSLLVSTSYRKPGNQIVPIIACMRWDTTSADNVNIIYKQDDYSLSPNPAKGYCLLKSNNGKENIFSLIDVNGKVILTDTYKTEYRLDTGKLSKGVYQVITGTKKDYKATTLKLVVE